MQIEKVPLILILGIISLYFLITGIRGLKQRRMQVPNPQADRTPTSMEDMALDFLRKRIDADNKVPASFGDKRQMIDIRGRDLYIRAWFHIIFGTITLLVLALYLWPSLFEPIMNLLL